MDCIDTQTLRYFAAVAEEGHLRNAARRLGVSAWRLKRVIKQLERQFDGPLTQADGGALSLTEEGRALLVSARAVLACWHSTPTSPAPHSVPDHLVIGVLDHSLPDLVARVLMEFHQHFPRVALRIREGSTNAQMQALENNELDVGFVRLPRHTDRAHLETLIEDPLYVVLPPHHRLLNHDNVALEQLAGESFIMPPRDRSGELVDQIIMLCEQADFRPRISHEAYQLSTLFALVSAGLGVAIMPCPGGVGHHGAQRRPLTVDGRPAEARVPLMMAWRDSNSRPALTHFLKLARQVARPSHVNR